MSTVIHEELLPLAGASFSRQRLPLNGEPELTAGGPVRRLNLQIAKERLL
jgi:hypothetical protein